MARWCKSCKRTCSCPFRERQTRCSLPILTSCDAVMRTESTTVLFRAVGGVPNGRRDAVECDHAAAAIEYPSARDLAARGQRFQNLRTRRRVSRCDCRLASTAAIRDAASKSLAASFRRLSWSSSANVEYISATATAQLNSAARVSFWLSDPCPSPNMLHPRISACREDANTSPYYKHKASQIQFGKHR